VPTERGNRVAPGGTEKDVRESRQAWRQSKRGNFRVCAGKEESEDEGTARRKSLRKKKKKKKRVQRRSKGKPPTGRANKGRRNVGTWKSMFRKIPLPPRPPGADERNQNTEGGKKKKNGNRALFRTRKRPSQIFQKKHDLPLTQKRSLDEVAKN